MYQCSTSSDGTSEVRSKTELRKIKNVPSREGHGHSLDEEGPEGSISLVCSIDAFCQILKHRTSILRRGLVACCKRQTIAPVDVVVTIPGYTTIESGDLWPN